MNPFLLFSLYVLELFDINIYMSKTIQQTSEC